MSVHDSTAHMNCCDVKLNDRVAIDVKLVEKFQSFVALETLKARKDELGDMELFRIPRLSVSAVTPAQFDAM